MPRTAAKHTITITNTVHRGRGRPSLYSRELAESICSEVASGKTLVDVCKARKLPMNTVFRWLNTHPEFHTLYERAKDVRLMVWAEELLTIADSPQLATKTKRTKVGNAFLCPNLECRAEVRWDRQKRAWFHKADDTPMCQADKKPKFEAIFQTEVTKGDNVERSKLMLQTREWLLARLAPAAYGDRIATELSGPNGGPIQVDGRAIALAEVLTPDQLLALKARLQGQIPAPSPTPEALAEAPQQEQDAEAEAQTEEEKIELK